MIYTERNINKLIDLCVSIFINVFSIASYVYTLLPYTLYISEEYKGFSPIYVARVSNLELQCVLLCVYCTFFSIIRHDIIYILRVLVRKRLLCWATNLIFQ